MKKGFTLIELLITLTIFSFFLTSFFYILGAQLRASNKVTLAASHSQTTNLLLNRIGRDVRAARQVLPDSSSLRLRLLIENDVIEYCFSGAGLKRKKNNSSSPLSSPGEIESLSFSYNDDLIETKINGKSLSASLRN